MKSTAKVLVDEKVDTVLVVYKIAEISLKSYLRLLFLRSFLYTGPFPSSSTRREEKRNEGLNTAVNIGFVSLWAGLN